MKALYYLLIFPHVEDRRFVEIQLQDAERKLLAANVVLANELRNSGIIQIQLRSPDEVYIEGQIL